MKLEEKKISSELIYDGRIINVFRDTVLLPNGNTAHREVVRHPGGVGVLAIDKDRNVYMVRQFRYPFDEVLLEIPAGKRDKFGESPEDVGRRELLEECGLKAGKMHSLGSVYPTCGYCDEEIFLFWTDDFEQAECCPDEDEFVEVEKISLDVLVGMVMRNEIKDSKTVAAILKLSVMLS